MVINELMATNKHTVQDPQGQYDDWLEVYNRSDRSVDVSGMYLSDSESELLKWSFPPGTTFPHTARSWSGWTTTCGPRADCTRISSSPRRARRSS